MDALPLICVIDDDALLRQTVGRILSGAGYAVVNAADGSKGIEVIERTSPVLVITDIVMPNQEGIETIIEAKRRFPAIPIIAISGGGPSGSRNFLEVARKLGADDCLAKPFRPAALLGKVAHLLESRNDAKAVVS
jgi:two-component system, chemotaxis family, chemotaxis protein CheY